MSQFLTQLKDNVLVADGAIGTILYSEGLDTCPEAYNLSHPDKVERIHRSYIEAGADVIQTNTYGANFEKLKRFGLEDKQYIKPPFASQKKQQIKIRIY